MRWRNAGGGSCTRSVPSDYFHGPSSGIAWYDFCVMLTRVWISRGIAGLAFGTGFLKV